MLSAVSLRHCRECKTTNGGPEAVLDLPKAREAHERQTSQLPNCVRFDFLVGLHSPGYFYRHYSGVRRASPAGQRESQCGAHDGL